jgi:hypothetical protein
MERPLEATKPFSARTASGLLAIAAILYAITTIPHVLAYAHAPPEMTFGGALVWAPDQDCYFSFIRQSADGHWIFLNRLTSIEHDRAYFNLEWLVVGKIMALLHGSTVWAYHIWRAAGALSVVFGFYALARVVVLDAKLRAIAMFLLLFGGSFRWSFVGWNAASRALESSLGWHLGTLSTEFGYFSVHPFAQVMANPHFSCPLGLFLLCIASYLRGERTSERSWYAISGALAAIEATMRPYEMIVLYTAIPLFAVIEIGVTRELDARKLGRRLLPLLVVAPVFLYTLYIFEIHPVFKYWSSQGVDAPTPIHETLMNLGMAGGMLFVRACFWRRFPLSSPIERMLAAWLVCVFFFIHGNTIPWLRFMPYTPQLMTSLIPSILLLGIPVLDPARWKWAGARPRLWSALLIAMLAVEAFDSAQLIDRVTPKGVPEEASLFIPTAEMEAFDWLAHHAVEDDVVLAVGSTGHRLTKYASVCVVAGHWSVTPMADKMEVLAERFYRGKMSFAQAQEFLAQCRVKWVFFGQSEGREAETLMESMPGYARHVVNPQVTIFGPRG